MTLKKAILGIVLFSFGTLLGYLIRSPGNILKDGRVETQILKEIPECFLGRCPVYKPADVDGDGLNESIVYQPTSMTKGGAQILIIKNGEIVFKSQEGAWLDYELDKDGADIAISYVEEIDGGIWPNVWETQKWVYGNGGYTRIDKPVGDCLEKLKKDSENEIISAFNGPFKNADFSTRPFAKTFQTAITEIVSKGPNFSGHYSLASWGCGTDCFGYSLVDTKTGEIISYNPSIGNYKLGGANLESKFFVMEPVKAGQEKRYYKVVEGESSKSRLELACTEISTADLYGEPE